MVFFYKPQAGDIDMHRYMVSIHGGIKWFAIENAAQILGKSPFPGYLIDVMWHKDRVPTEIVDRCNDLGFTRIRIDDSAARALYQAHHGESE